VRYKRLPKWLRQTFTQPPTQTVNNHLIYLICNHARLNLRVQHNIPASNALDIVPGGLGLCQNIVDICKPMAPASFKIGEIYYAVGENKTVVEWNLTKADYSNPWHATNPGLRELGVC